MNKKMDWYKITAIIIMVVSTLYLFISMLK